MFGKFLSALVTVLGGGKYRVSLDRRPGGFVLQASQGKNPIPLSKAASKYEPLSSFSCLTSQTDHSILLPAGLLEEARTVLQGISGDGLEVLIAPDVDSLKLASPPPGFSVKYVWDPASRCIETRVDEGAVHLGEGWFVAGDRYWQVGSTLPEDDRWLGRSAVEGQDIVTLVSRVAPVWRKRGMPYLCELRFDESPALRISLGQILDTEVELDLIWRVAEASLQEVASLPGYVVASGALMPGVPPQTLLRSLLATTGRLRLSGQQVPRFMREVWPSVKPFADGNVGDLLRLHPVLKDKAELILTVGSQMKDGIGVVTASPRVCVGDTHVDAADISHQLDVHTEYIRTASGWLPRSSIAGLGIGPLGRLDDGMPLEPIKLSPVDVLKRGSERLEGPWSRIEFPDLRLPQGSSPADTARLHVQFLCRWRIPGGIISTSEEVVRAFAESVASVVSEFPAAKVLVIGTRERLDRLDPVWTAQRGIRLNGLKKDPKLPAGYKGLVAASPRALDTAPELLKPQWTIVCLLEADSLVKSDSSQFFINLRGCRKSLVLGQFGGTDFRKRTVARDAISQIFHVEGYGTLELFERYGLRDPLSKTPPVLPSPYQLQHKARRQPERTRPAVIDLGGSPGPGGMSIPPRPAPAEKAEPKADPRRFEIKIERHQIEYGYSPSHGTFVAEARRLAGHWERHASFVPFMCYWPTYDSMSAAQRKWYFYWRGQVRDGSYMDTDLSYIFVHVYELINGVGARDATDGYEQLWRLWMGYRERYPKLDGYLADWLTDYLLVNRSGAEAMKAHIEALPPGASPREPDLFLGYFVGASPMRLPVALMEALCDYRIDRSRFYLDGNQDLMDKILPEVLDAADAHLRVKAGLAVFDLFRPRSAETVRRFLFQSAVHDGATRPLAAMIVIPYSRHQPLRDFLTALVKHTENRLREMQGYEGKLRGYSLDPAIQAAVDAFLGYRSKSAPVVTKQKAGTRTIIAPPRVVIDMTKVRDLERESAEVRDILLGEGTTKVETPPAEVLTGEAQERDRPPEGLQETQVEQDPIEAFFARLTENERNLVGAVAGSGWEIGEDSLRRSLPGELLEPLIDEINERAREFLGDLLLSYEEDLLVASDDLRDDLSAYLSANTAGGAGQVEGGWSPEGLPPEWGAFASGLEEPQLEALRSIVDLSDPMLAIRDIADNHATMPGLLIDSINELALETIGDHIIEPDSDPPVIEEEDFQMVAKVLSTLATRPDR